MPTKRSPPTPMPKAGTLEFADWLQGHADTLITTLQEIIGEENAKEYTCFMMGCKTENVDGQGSLMRVRLRGEHQMMLHTMAHLLIAMAQEAANQGYDTKQVALEKLVNQMLYLIEQSVILFQTVT